MNVPSLLALTASCCLVGILSVPSIAHGQNDVANQTCRVALDGSELTEITPTDQDRSCCYVLEESDWYGQHNVLLRHVYQREDDGLAYLTRQCDASLSPSGGTGADDGTGSAGPSLSSSPQGGPSSTPEQLGNPGPCTLERLVV